MTLQKTIGALAFSTLAMACKPETTQLPTAKPEVVGKERARFDACLAKINSHGFCDDNDAQKTCVSGTGELMIDGQYVKEKPGAELYDQLANKCEVKYQNAFAKLQAGRKRLVTCLGELNKLKIDELCYDTSFHGFVSDKQIEETTCIDTNTGAVTSKSQDGEMSGLDIRLFSLGGLEKASQACELKVLEAEK